LPVAVRVRIQLAGNDAGSLHSQQPIMIVVPIDTQSRTNQTQGSAN
jgi:hypothetical protein